MKRIIGLFCIAAMFLPVMNAAAIDRGAQMIDRVNFDVATLDDADIIGGSILGESALSQDRWAILFGGGTGTISPLLEGHNTDYWNVLVGAKLYLCPYTSLSAYGKYEEFHVGGVSRDAKSATFQCKQRLLPADRAVSPFVAGGLTIRDRSTFTDLGTEESFSENLWCAGGGCEFAMNEDLSFSFEAYRQFADSSHDGAEDLDGWLGTISMIYYWNSAD
jgi:hypothetical protein